MKSSIKFHIITGFALVVFVLLSQNVFSQTTTITCPDGDLYTCYVNGTIKVYKGIGKSTVVIQ